MNNSLFVKTTGAKLSHFYKIMNIFYGMVHGQQKRVMNRTVHNPFKVREARLEHSLTPGFFQK